MAAIAAAHIGEFDARDDARQDEAGQSEDGEARHAAERLAEIRRDIAARRSTIMAAIGVAVLGRAGAFVAGASRHFRDLALWPRRRLLILAIVSKMRGIGLFDATSGGGVQRRPTGLAASDSWISIPLASHAADETPQRKRRGEGWFGFVPKHDDKMTERAGLAGEASERPCQNKPCTNQRGGGAFAADQSLRGTARSAGPSRSST